MSRDDLNDIPSFAANRDEAVSSAPRGAIPATCAQRAEAVMGLTATAGADHCLSGGRYRLWLGMAVTDSVG